MRTSNPMMKESVFTQAIAGTETMTLQGAVNKTIALLALVVIGASYSWNLFYNQGAAAVQPWMIGGIIGSLVFAPRNRTIHIFNLCLYTCGIIFFSHRNSTGSAVNQGLS